MLRNHTISSSLSTSISGAVPASLAKSLRGAAKERATGTVATTAQVGYGTWQLLAQTLRLPDTMRAFWLFLLAVTVICVGMILHLLLAISILESRIELAQLDAEYRAVRRESTTLIWAISQETTLDRVNARAVAAGYEPSFERLYVIQPLMVPALAGVPTGTGATNAVATPLDEQSALNPGLSPNGN